MRTRALAVGLLVAAPSCRRDEPTPEPAPAELQRGDTVVVERSAATFFEGRLLALSSSTLTVQTTKGGDPLVVARDDVYGVRTGGTLPRSGSYAICGGDAASWFPCRVVGNDANGTTVVDADEQTHRLATGRVIAPSPVTQLNIERHFMRARDRRAFRDAARSAGRPVRPGRWSPESADRVIAEDGDVWYSARAVSEADGGVRLVWEGARGEAMLPEARVVPPPPYPYEFSSGEFALLEPPTPAQPWRPVRVESVSGDGIVVNDEAGVRVTVSARKLIPLRPE